MMAFLVGNIRVKCSRSGISDEIPPKKKQVLWYHSSALTLKKRLAGSKNRVADLKKTVAGLKKRVASFENSKATQNLGSHDGSLEISHLASR